MNFDQKVKDEIVKQLNEKEALQPCARCGYENFSLLNGFVNLLLNREVSGRIEGPRIPCAVTACNNCGSINYHAVGALELMKKNKNIMMKNREEPALITDNPMEENLYNTTQSKLVIITDDKLKAILN